MKPIVPGGQPLFRECQDRVFYMYNNMPPKPRERYTVDPCDYPQNEQRSSIPLWLFWRPHLSQVVDLDARKAEFRARQAAGEAIAARFKRAYVSVIKNFIETRSKGMRSKGVTCLLRNEARRWHGPRPFKDSTESPAQAGWHQELMNHADKLREPF